MNKKFLFALSITVTLLLFLGNQSVDLDSISPKTEYETLDVDALLGSDSADDNYEITIDDSTSQTDDIAETEIPAPDDTLASPEISEPDSVKLVMVGDILMHDPVLESGKTEEGYSYHHIFANVADEISAADIAMFNQEVMIAGEKYGIRGYPAFNAPFELADAIAAVGFDVAVHATNHTLDVGKQALLECLSNWETKYPNIEVVGMHDSDDDAQKISVIEKNGIKIAILNYTYGVNGVGSATLASEPYLVDMLDENRIRKDTKKASEIADFIIVAAHWGTEYTHTPSDSQQKWADIMLECGVDLVLGTHPHVIQPVEWLEHENGNKMLVYWSLGNFVNSTGETGVGKGARMLGAMADVSIEKGEDGRAYISEAFAIPLVTHIKYETLGITTYFFDEYTEEMLSKSEATKIDHTFSYSYCESTFAEVLGEFIKK